MLQLLLARFLQLQQRCILLKTRVFRGAHTCLYKQVSHVKSHRDIRIHVNVLCATVLEAVLYKSSAIRSLLLKDASAVMMHLVARSKLHDKLHLIAQKNISINRSDGLKGRRCRLYHFRL